MKLPVDHSAFITGPFATGPDVTKQCLTCHDAQAEHVLASGHWNWQGPANDVLGRENVVAGKANGINNFCISIAGNETRCTSCHIGYGWDGKAEFDFTDKTKIDCLVCHDTTDTYKKAPPAAGNPDPKVDLVKVAQNVGKPDRDNCGSCHFYAGGGDAVKSPGLDSTLKNPTREHDVHMGGAGLVCQDCHQTEDHQVPGGSLHVIPTYAGRVACEDCHTGAPHKSNETLNKHTAAVACQTCHIPTFATGQATKMYWDWSTAGQDKEAPKDQYGKPTYDKMKGDFVWQKDVKPVYAWYNGKSERYLLGDPVNRGGITTLAKPVGDINDKNAKIYPFKLFGGKQISDAVNGYLITPHLFGGYWKHYDWNQAARDGMAKSGLAYSGSYEFVETNMYMLVNHEVVPKDKALTCGSCHTENGALDFKALGYEGDPMKVGGRKVQ
ncbi:cytochrome C [Clostridiales bacterium PH28_bin88]|nr:cytochrome C [Clostridiales bacterium PH28_bin88]